MTKNIIQDKKECYLCRMKADELDYYGALPSTGLHRHHIIFGSGNRRLSEMYGLWVYLCPDHHEFGPDAVHSCRATRELLSKAAQEAFEETYSHDEWMSAFGKNWI